MFLTELSKAGDFGTKTVAIRRKYFINKILINGSKNEITQTLTYLFQNHLRKFHIFAFKNKPKNVSENFELKKYFFLNTFLMFGIRKISGKYLLLLVVYLFIFLL